MALGEGESVHIVWSHCLGQGSETGFAFVFRPGRLMGASKPTTATIILGTSSFSRTETRPARWSLFHRSADPGERTMREVQREILGSATGSKVVRFGEATTVVRVAKDPEEARRIAAELGIDLGALTGGGASPPLMITNLDPGKPHGAPGGRLPPGGPPDLGWIPRDPAALLAELEGAKVFELTADRIERIEVVAPTASRPGRIVIRTPAGVEVVNVTAPLAPAEDPIPALLPQFEALAPGRVVGPTTGP